MESLSVNWAGATVQKGIESGTIKLLGPTGTVEQAKKNAAIDAAYILALMTALTAKTRD